MTDTMPGSAPAFVGVGGIANALGVSSQTVRNLERAGVIPPAGRTEPGSRRIWPAGDLVEIRARVNERRAAGRQQGGPGRAA